MYLLKQWRESRIISILVPIGLALLLALVVRTGVAMDTVHFGDASDHRGSFGMAFVPFFYVEAVLVAFWGWLAAGIGAGKNLGEGSGSFLFTRPRRRAWFLWSDWAYAMAHIAVMIVLANLMIGLLLAHILHLMHMPAAVPLADGAEPVSLAVIMVLISVGVLLFAGLIYGLTYFSTIALQRAAGVMLGAGIVVCYLILSGLVSHYWPGVHLPNLILGLFDFGHHSFHGFSSNLAIKIVVRAAVMMAFPIAAQLILDRSEI
jgi:hypothetical protein